MSKYLSDHNLHVLTNVISGVESYGQRYSDERNWGSWADAYANTSNENSITIGWQQSFREEARSLLQRILKADPKTFRKLDNAGIEQDLQRSFSNYTPKKGSAKSKAIIAIITSDVGKRCQDEQFYELAEKYMANAVSFGVPTSNPKALGFWVEIQHLGGLNAAKRIFNRCGKNPTPTQVMNALKKDQSDTSSSNQVGDKIFWSRHECCQKWFDKYMDSSKPSTTTTNKTTTTTTKKATTTTTKKTTTTVKKTTTINKATALSKAKTLLRMPQGETMTGYTPTGKSYFVNAKAWYTSPKKGDVIYFYSSTKGRVGHVGIVERVDTASKTVFTIEGNTSSTAYAENGGCVARHSYSYAKQGGTNRVNGFGRPNFAGAGVTADAFVNAAIANLGYLEKRSNSNLDSKTANAGSNNYQKFQRDVGAGNGGQWCQYFVSATALYTCQGITTSTVSGSSTTSQTTSNSKTLNEKKQKDGIVTAKALNVRTWAGTEYPTCSFSPLAHGQKVGICDTVYAANGDKWFYIVWAGKHGFVSAKYIV